MKDLIVSVLWTMAALNISVSHATLTLAKWNKHLRNFESIAGIPSYEIVRQNVQRQARAQETHNFNGESLFLMYYEQNDDVNFVDNDTKVTGLFGDIWTLLSDVLNFTLVAQKSAETTLGIYFANGTYGGILEYARLNQTDIIPRAEFYRTRLPAVEFSSPFWMSGQKIFAHGYWKRNRTWMFTIFPLEIWGIILVFIVTLSLLSTISQKLSLRHKNPNIRSRTYIDHLFYTFATLCNQGELNQGEVYEDNDHHIGNGSRLLAVTISIFSWLILIGYSSHMIYSMTKEHFDAPFKDLESLFTDTNFRIAVINGSVSDIILSNPKSGEIYYRFKAAQRVTVVPNQDELYRKVCLNMNQYVLMHGEDTVLSRSNPVCTLIPVGVAHYRTPIASGISRRVKNKRALDIGIRRLAEFGLLNAIKRRYTFPIREESSARIIDTLAIDMDRVFLIFGILGIGMILSIIICTVENIIFRLQNRTDIQGPHRTFPITK